VITVAEFMNTDVATETVDATLLDVTRHMDRERLSCLLIVDGKNPIGIITERDCVKYLARMLAGEKLGTVASLMTTNLLVVYRDTSCDEAAALMKGRNVRRVVVLDENDEMCGLITRTNLLRAHAHELEQQRAVLEQRVEERTRDLDVLVKKLKEQSLEDPMLKVGNRRAMDMEVAKLYEYTRRYKRQYAVALVDVDRFKHYNDHYGHQLGDEILIKLAACIKGVIRRTDSVYRYGGEEFLVLFLEVGLESGKVAAEHIRRAVEELKIVHEGIETPYVTVSIGVANEDIDCPDPLKTIGRADEALYRAKHNGRNRVEGALTEQNLAA
jgi:diguanylate cyclase (GGDEF)-like protein